MNAAGSVLVDTNVVIAYLGGDKGLHPRFAEAPDNNLWIAAMARQHDLPLATRDAHFAQVPRFKTLAW